MVLISRLQSKELSLIHISAIELIELQKLVDAHTLACLNMVDHNAVLDTVDV